LVRASTGPSSDPPLCFFRIVTEIHLEHSKKCLDVYAGKIRLVRSGLSGNKVVVTEETKAAPLTDGSDDDEAEDAASEISEIDDKNESEDESDSGDPPATAQMQHSQKGTGQEQKVTKDDRSELFKGRVFSSSELAGEVIKTTMLKRGYKMVSTGTNRGIRTYYRCYNHRTLHSTDGRAGACKCHVFVTKLEDNKSW